MTIKSKLFIFILNQCSCPSSNITVDTSPLCSMMVKEVVVGVMVMVIVVKIVATGFAAC